ncbi:MAG: hypothetical protein ACJAZP_000362 [Psychromonas sp.]|jgi:hypothetical protein
MRVKLIGYIGKLCSLSFINPLFSPVIKAVIFIEVTFMISWPCMLKLAGDDELIYLDSELDFMSECRELILCDDDHVIDSVGDSYLIEEISGKLALIKTERVLTAYAVSNLIRAHEFKKATLCLTKIHFLTVSDAIKSLSY